jgi:bacterioferritin (cytochrome b1)
MLPIVRRRAGHSATAAAAPQLVREPRTKELMTVVTNVEYDILATLQTKLEGADLYQQYIKDCEDSGDQECRRVFEEIKRDDERHAEQLRAQLRKLLSQAA